MNGYKNVAVFYCVIRFVHCNAHSFLIEFAYNLPKPFAMPLIILPLLSILSPGQ